MHPDIWNPAGQKLLRWGVDPFRKMLVAAVLMSDKDRNRSLVHEVISHASEQPFA